MALKLEPGTKLVVATHNPGKARELAEILENRFTLTTAGELGLPEPDETETTFVGNALLKARAASIRRAGRDRGATSRWPCARWRNGWRRRRRGTSRPGSPAPWPWPGR